MSVYQSTLVRGSGQNNPGHWEDLPNLTINNMALSELRSQDRSAWCDRIPLSPKTLRDVFACGYDGRVKINMDVTPYRQFKAHMIWDDNRNYFADIVYDAGAHPQIKASTISIPEEHRGQGIGKRFIRNFMEFHWAIGGKTFLFSAGKDNGGYSWASMGGNLDMRPIYRSSLIDVSQQLFGRFSIARSFLPEEIYDGVRECLALRRKDDLARLVRDYRHVYVPRHLQPDMGDVSEHIFSSRLKKFMKAVDPENPRITQEAYEEVRLIGRAFQWAAMQGQSGLSLPRYLLTGGIWPGVVDNHDNDQMQTVGHYLGGWKTIRPVENPRPVLNASSIPVMING